MFKRFLLIIVVFVSLYNIGFADFKIITRDEWGANTTYLNKELHKKPCEKNNTCTYTGPTLDEINQEIEDNKRYIEQFYNTPLKEILYERSHGVFKDISNQAFLSLMKLIFPDINSYSKTIYQTNNFYLWWPWYYSSNIKKIVIHHTAEGSNEDLNDDGIIDIKDFNLYLDANGDGEITDSDYITLVQNIYHFHALSRDWGDVGYHYIIDPVGNVYEGRSGGDYVVGGHALYANTETISIAVIGNYDNIKLSPETKTALINTITYLGKKYKINPLNQSYFRNTYGYDVMTHKDFAYTNCAGSNLISELGDIRQQAYSQIYNISINTTKTNLSFVQKNDPSFPIEQGRPKNISFSIQNTSTTTWNKNTYIKFKDTLGVKFLNQKIFLENLLEPGRTTSLLVKIIPIKSDNITLEGDIYINETTKLNSPIVLTGIRDMKNVAIEVETKPIKVSRSAPTKIKIPFKNTGDSLGKKTVNKIYIAPADSITKTFYDPATWIKPNQIVQNSQNIVNYGGVDYFEFNLSPKGSGNNLIFEVKSLYSEKPIPNTEINIPIEWVDTDLNKNNSGISLNNLTTDKIRVKIDFAYKDIVLKSNTPYSLQNHLGNIISNNVSNIYIDIQNGKLRTNINSQDHFDDTYFKLIPHQTNQTISIDNMSKPSSFDPKINYNTFTDTIEVRIEDNKIIAINELGITEYMKGIAETTPDTPIEKKKAIALAAKNYALYYTQKGKEKFPGKPYHLDSLPANSQYYLGYTYSTVNTSWVEAVKATENEIIVYDNKLIKTPYFSTSDGKTKSAWEVWRWDDTPYLISVDDPYCIGLVQRGHGVGMSGCGSKEMALAGKNYKEILKYYYKDIDIIPIK